MPRLSNVASCGQLCLHSNASRPRDFTDRYSQHARRSAGRVCSLDLDGGGQKISLGRKLPLCGTSVCVPKLPDRSLAQAGAALTGSSPNVSARESAMRKDVAQRKLSSRDGRRTFSQPAPAKAEATYFSDIEKRNGKPRPMPRPVLT